MVYDIGGSERLPAHTDAHADAAGVGAEHTREIGMDGIENQRFVEQFEQLFREIESIVQEYPPELREALRDEARVALRLQLQERWEENQRIGSERNR